jgi:hypothetical protein
MRDAAQVHFAQWIEGQVDVYRRSGDSPAVSIRAG